VPFVDKNVATAVGYVKADKVMKQHVETDDKLRYQIGTSGQKRDNIDSKPPADGYAEAYQKNMEFLKISYHVQNHAHVLCQLVFFL
jgi:IMP cyclohydrolase